MGIPHTLWAVSWGDPQDNPWYVVWMSLVSWGASCYIPWAIPWNCLLYRLDYSSIRTFIEMFFMPWSRYIPYHILCDAHGRSFIS